MVSSGKKVRRDRKNGHVYTIWKPMQCSLTEKTCRKNSFHFHLHSTTDLNLFFVCAPLKARATTHQNQLNCMVSAIRFDTNRTNSICIRYTYTAFMHSISVENSFIHHCDIRCCFRCSFIFSLSRIYRSMPDHTLISCQLLRYVIEIYVFRSGIHFRSIADAVC